MSCGVGYASIEVFEDALFEKAFVLKVEVDGVVSLRDITWAESGRFTIYNDEDGTSYVDTTAGITITAASSRIDLAIPQETMTGFAWETAKFQLRLVDTDGQQRVVVFGDVTNLSFVE